jgi:hypothetical protein
MKDTEAPRWFANQVRLKPNKVLVTPSWNKKKSEKQSSN